MFAVDAAAILENSLHILLAALGLGLVIFWHELGHFAVAKWCGVFVERFSIGFGPILWSFKRKETEYALSAIPFGGYVKMLGQDDMDPSQLTTDEIAQDPRSYSAKSVPQRMAIISAGVIMNIITALLFFALAFHFGVPTSPATVGQVIIGKPAWQKGMQPGDRITRINGRDTHSFADILRGTTLSHGDNIEIEGVHPDGSTFKVVLNPDMSKNRRMIGISDAKSLNVAELGKESKSAVVPGTPAAAANPTFQKDDRIVEVGGVEVATHAELQKLLAARRAETLDFVVERAGKQQTISVAPWKFRELGLWMAIEPIAAIRDGSPAAAADGLQPGDTILSINGEEIGTDINPLHLADYFLQHAGEKVEVRVKRAVKDSPELAEITVTIEPDGSRSDSGQPTTDDTPLAIPSIGVAVHLTPTVLKVVEGSPAHKAGIPRDATVKSMTISTADKVFIDMTGRKELKIEFDKTEKKNMAFALWQLQEIPEAKVALTYVKDGKEKTVQLAAADSSSDLYLPKRGVILFPESKTLKSDGFADALSMGLYQTRNTAIDIYLTLRNLVMRELSPKNLHGPLGIAQVAFEVSRQGMPKLLLFLGFLSVNLAVLNFLPIPVLDGGHMVFLIWEGVTRKRPSERVLIAATYCGMAFVLGLMLFVIYLDIFFHPFEMQ